jgi:hypothetical protein
VTHRASPAASLSHPRFAALAFATLASFAPAVAFAQDLQTDGSDPNGAPPPPPAMPPPGQPGSVAPPPPPGSTQQKLQQSTEQDTGVGLHFVYLQPEIGFGVAGLGGSLPDSAKDSRTAVGPVFGLGGGFEFIAFQLGARVRYMPTSKFDLWSAGGEIAYQPGSGRFWPRIGLGVGWAWAKNFDAAKCGLFCSESESKGLDLGLRGGVQYYLTPHIEIGADVSLDVLFLSRSGLPVPNVEYATDGSGTGYSATVFGHAGFHFP